MTDVTLTEARAKALEAQRQIQEAQEVMAGAIKEALAEGTAALFEKYPFLGAIGWTQYTPYFNDGEACVFSTSFTYPGCSSVVDVENENVSAYEDGGEDFAVKSQEVLYGDYNRETRSYSKSPNPEFDPAYRDCYDEVSQFCRDLAGNEKRDYTADVPTNFDQALLRAFGDHVQVTIYRDGKIVVDEYYHD